MTGAAGKIAMRARRALRARCRIGVHAMAIGMAVAAPLAGLAQTPETITYQYDDAGRLKSADTSLGAHVDYQYDPAGNRTGVNTALAAASGTLQLTASSWSVAENVAGGALAVTVARAGGTNGTATVQCTASSGAATAGADFTNPGATLTWGSGVGGNQSCVIPISNDSAYEGSESFTVTLSGATVAYLGAPATATVTITDDDPQPPAGSLQFTGATASVAENVAGGTLALTVSRTGGSYGAASVFCSATGGTAVAGVDFTSPAQTLSWSSGDASSKTCTVAIANDASYESDETFTASLSAATGASLGSQSSTLVTITNDDPQPPAGTLQFTASSASATETAASITLTVTRSGGSFGAISASCATTDGTALAGSDYTTVNDLLSWADGETASKPCVVPLINDAAYELAESLTVTLSGATLGTPATATVTINDDDPQPPAGTVQLTGTSWSVAENVAGGLVAVTVSRVGGSFGAASVLCSAASVSATVGADFTNPAQTLSWANGDVATKTCNVPIINDAPYEVDESFQVNLSSVSGAALGTPSSATVTITNDDPPPQPGTLSISPTSYSVFENVGTAIVTVGRTGGIDGAVSAFLGTGGGTATAGSDYGATGATLTWNDGVGGTQQLAISIYNDSFADPSETIGLTLSNPMGGATLGTTAGTVTVDDDAAGVVTLSDAQSVSEGVGSVTFTVNRYSETNGAVSVQYSTVNGTAVAGSDFTSTSGTFSWASGQSQPQTFSIPIINDAVGEINETFEVVLSNATGGVAMVGDRTVTIVDDDSSLPPTPSGPYSNDPIPVTDGNYIVSWSSSGPAAAYYRLQESNDDTFSSATNYIINAPTTSKQFTGAQSAELNYRVQACTSANQCSAYSGTLYVLICTGACQ